MKKITNLEFIQATTITREYLLQEIENLDNLLELEKVREIVLNTPVVDLDLSVRCKNVLRDFDIFKVSDLIKFSERELLMHRQFGKKSMVEIKDVLTNLNLSLRQE